MSDCKHAGTAASTRMSHTITAPCPARAPMTAALTPPWAFSSGMEATRPRSSPVHGATVVMTGHNSKTSRITTRMLEWVATLGVRAVSRTPLSSTLRTTSPFCGRTQMPHTKQRPIIPSLPGQRVSDLFTVPPIPLTMPQVTSPFLSSKTARLAIPTTSTTKTPISPLAASTSVGMLKRLQPRSTTPLKVLSLMGKRVCPDPASQ